MARSAEQTLGAVGERLALEHYERLGYGLVARNQRTRSGELDLIVADRAVLVFVEVKTRRAGGLDPLSAITPSKVRQLRRLALQWLAMHPHRPRRTELRIDAVAVVIDADGKLVALDQVTGIG